MLRQHNSQENHQTQNLKDGLGRPSKLKQRDYTVIPEKETDERDNHDGKQKCQEYSKSI